MPGGGVLIRTCDAQTEVYATSEAQTEVYATSEVQTEVCATSTTELFLETRGWRVH